MIDFIVENPPLHRRSLYKREVTIKPLVRDKAAELKGRIRTR